MQSIISQSNPMPNVPRTSMLSSSINNPQVSDWGNTLYNGASDVGVFKADLTLIICLILSTILFVVGIYMIIYDDDEKYLRIKGVVVQPNCTVASKTVDAKGISSTNYKCNVAVNYSINNKLYSKTIFTSGTTSYVKDEPVDLMILKTDYMNAQFAQMSNQSIGYILVLAAIGISGASYINYYLTHNYKLFAAAQGASAVAGLFR